VPPETLGDELLRLPMSAWPRGPSIIISPTDDVRDSHAPDARFENAIRVCRDLGLDVQRRMGG
jgi:hypothetical protein